jgi:RNA polymerase sigma factor (sigma-70 family)
VRVLATYKKALLEELEIINGLKAGEERAFRRLVELYQNRVYNTAMGFLRSEQNAEDVSQEVFITVYEAVGKFRGDAALATWLYRITVTKSLELIRKQRRKKRLGRIFGLFDQKQAWNIAGYDHPGTTLEDRETAQALFRAIDNLPENQRIAFTLHKLEGLNHEAISQIMQNSVGAVESLIHRANQNLRKNLNTYYQEIK